VKILIEKVWSNNVLLPKASIIKTKSGDKYYPSLPTNNYKNYTYRLKLTIKKNV
jgi:hypothetical protein